VILGAALLLAGMTIGALIARQPQTALRAWRWEIAEPLVYAALLVWWLRGRWLRRSLWACVASGALVAALALAQAVFAHVTFAPLSAGGGLVRYPAWNGLDWRATAIIYGSPNTAGAWMARALPLALAVTLWPRAAGARPRWLAAVAAAALLVGLALTGSRGAWLGAAAGAAVVVGGLAMARVRRPQLAHGAGGPANAFAPEGHLATTSAFADASVANSAPRRRVLWRDALRWESIRWPSPWGAITVLTLVATLVYGLSSLWLAPLVGLVGAAHGGSGDERLLVWQAAQAMGRDHPLLGVGPDQFLYYYDPRYTRHPYLIATVNGHPSVTAHLPNLSHPHNLGLELWLSAGVIGLVGFMLALVGAVWRGVSTLYWSGGGQAGWRGAVAIGVMGALVAGLAHGLVDSAYFEPDYALAFWWGVAALVALGHAPSRSHSTATTSRS
jgi:putative inorganic carbon (hco3(-)) transporter